MQSPKRHVFKEKTGRWVMSRIVVVIPRRFIKHCAMKACGGSGCIDPRYLGFGISWMPVVSCMLRPLYLRGKNPVPIG
jgi:hypothetical protein